MRGMLTDAVKAKSKELLGYEISQRELRLIPYLQYCMCNERKVSQYHVNDEERALLDAWQNRGWVDMALQGTLVSKPFWDAMCEILWLSYVNYDQTMLPEPDPELPPQADV